MEVKGNIYGGGGAYPAGSDTYVQYNNGGIIGGDSAFTFNDATKALTVGGLILGAGSITMTGSLGATGARVTKGWFTDLECTNAMVGGLISLSSSSGILMKNFNGATVASFGLGGADSLNVGLLGNTVNTGNFTKTGCCVLNTNSAVFQPTTDSTTFFKIMDADGGAAILTVDSVNEMVLFRDTAIGIYSQADTFLDIFADGGLRIGDSSAGAPTNYTKFAANGNQTFVGTAGFYPRFLTQGTEPAAGTGATECDTSEMVVWKDSDDNKVYLCFNDGGTVKTVELA